MADNQNKNPLEGISRTLSGLSEEVFSTGFNLVAKTAKLPLGVVEGFLKALDTSKVSKKKTGQSTGWPQTFLDDLRFTPPLFTLGVEYIEGLGTIPDAPPTIGSDLEEAFKNHGYPLANPKVLLVPKGNPGYKWHIQDGEKRYNLEKVEKHLRTEEIQNPTRGLMLDSGMLSDLEKGPLPKTLRDALQETGISLSENATVSEWTKSPSDEDKDGYHLACKIADDDAEYALSGHQRPKAKQVYMRVQLILNPDILAELEKDTLSQEFREVLQTAGATLSANATVSDWTKSPAPKAVQKGGQIRLEPDPSGGYSIACKITDETGEYYLVGNQPAAHQSAGMGLRMVRFVFNLVQKFENELDQGVLSEDLREAFKKNKYSLSLEAKIEKTVLGFPPIQWQFKDDKTVYTIVNKGQCLYVYRDLPPDALYVDPIGDKLIERFLGLDPFQQLFFIASGFYDPDESLNIAKEVEVLEYVYNPYRVLRWLRGQSDDIDPVTQGDTLEFVQNYFKQTEPLPEWADAGLLAKAEEVFCVYKIPYMIVLLFRALPETYACWRGAQVLTTTNRLVINPDDATHNQIARLSHRVMASGQFVLNVMSRGGLNPDGTGIRTTQVLRLIHAGIRFIIQNVGATRDLDRSQWNYPRLGEPINQEDLLMTMLAFSTVVIDGMKKFNIHLKSDEEDAIFHRWKVMGYYLGIREDLLEKLETADDGRALWDAIVRKQQDYEQDHPTRDEIQAGVDLTNAVITYAQTITKGEMPREMPEYLIRYLVGNNLADRLGVPEVESLEPQVLTLLTRLNWGVVEAISDRSLIARKVFRAFRDATVLRLFDDWVVEHPVTFYKTTDTDKTRASEA